MHKQIKKKDIIITNKMYNRLILEAKSLYEIDKIKSMFEFQQDVPIWKKRNEKVRR